MQTKFILIIPLLMALLQWSCGEEAEEMPDWNITLTPVNEAYSGEYATVEVNVSKAVDIHISVDGSVMKSTSDGSLVYDVSALPVGSHIVKVAVADSYGVYEKSFSCRIVAKPNDGTNNDKPNNNPEMMYDYVDLGLPSGTLWATCNVGAKNPWNYGGCYAWGEVTMKDEYSKETYRFKGSPSVLDAAHDAATVNMGSNWRMPTKAECDELSENCEWEWTDDYNGKGVAGYIVKSRISSNSIFLPAAGYCHGGRGNVGSYGCYWSSSGYDSYSAWELYFSSDRRGVYGYTGRYHYFGYSVRAVRCR